MGMTIQEIVSSSGILYDPGVVHSCLQFLKENGFRLRLLREVSYLDRIAVIILTIHTLHI